MRPGPDSSFTHSRSILHARRSRAEIYILIGREPQVGLKVHQKPLIRVLPGWIKPGVLTLRSGAVVLLAASTALAQPSKQAMAHLGAGLRLFGLQRYSEAAKEFNLALDGDPSLQAARYHLAVSRFNERQFDAARRQFERLAVASYRRRWVTYYLARLDLLRGHFDEAIRRFESLGSSQPLQDELYYLGSAFLGKGDASHAVQSLKKEIAFNPRDFRAHYLLGRAYMMLRQASQARSQFEESERLHQYYLQGKQDLAACRQLLQAGHEREAWARCGPVLQTNDIDKLVAVGMLFGEFSDYGRAVQSLRNALIFDPASPEINYDLGYTYYQMEDYARASKYSQIAVAKSPDFFEALEVYGMALYKTGRADAARPVLTRACQLRPDDRTVAEVLSQIERRPSK